MPKPKTVAFIYGWSEGQWHSKKLESKLAKAGIKTTRQINKADVIFCHSTGCYLVPKNAKAKKIILAGLPYWPDRSLVYSGLLKIREDLHHTKVDMGLMWWLNKTLHNLWYMIIYPRDTLFVATKHRAENLPDPRRHNVVLIRNSDDPFCHPKIGNILSQAKKYKTIQLPAGHDDCWTAKKPYIDIVCESFSGFD
jgi:hypothetical protein